MPSLNFLINRRGMTMNKINLKLLASLTLLSLSNSMLHATPKNQTKASSPTTQNTRGPKTDSFLAETGKMYLKFEANLHKLGKTVVGWPSGKAINFAKYVLKSFALSPDCFSGRVSRSIGGDIIKNEYIAKAKAELWDDASKYRVLIPLAILIPTIKRTGIYGFGPAGTAIFTTNRGNVIMWTGIALTLLSLLGYDYYNDTAKAVDAEQNPEIKLQTEEISSIAVVTATEPETTTVTPTNLEDAPQETPATVATTISLEKEEEPVAQTELPTEVAIPAVLVAQEEVAQELPSDVTAPIEPAQILPNEAQIASNDSTLPEELEEAAVETDTYEESTIPA